MLSLTANGNQNVLLPFNTTRIPGSSESHKVQDFIINYFRELNHQWDLEQDSFEENSHNFTNLVFSNGDAETYVVFAAHYDSKIEPEGFIGAMDSAVSCGILMYMAGFIDQLCSTDNSLIYRALLENCVGIKFVFFDGEEALDQWGPDDSIYGAKNLASRWARESILDRIDLLVLLDLIGSDEHLPIPSYFAGSHLYYEILNQLEDAYLSTRPNESKSLDPSNHKFLDYRKLVIEDDHMPFYNAGIDVLHLIPFPFPKTWHTIDDNFQHLSQEEIYKWATLLSDFLIDVVQMYN